MKQGWWRTGAWVWSGLSLLSSCGRTQLGTASSEPPSVRRRWTTRLVHSATSAPWTSLQVGDFDDDGSADIAVWKKTGDVLWGDGAAGFRIAEGWLDPGDFFEIRWL